MKQVKGAESQRLTTRWHHQDHRFDIPKAEQENDVPSGQDVSVNLRPVNVPEHLPVVCSFQASNIDQVGVHSAARPGNGCPAKPEITNKKSQHDNCSALVKESRPRSIE